MVPVTSLEEEEPYGYLEEEREWIRYPNTSYQDGQVNMDWKTLMFTVGHIRMPMAPKRAPNEPLGPCSNCGGDHLIKDCPFPRQPRPQVPKNNISLLTKYCIDCGIKHLVIDCPMHPNKKQKVTLNLLETIPSEAESEGGISVKVVTRAQGRKEGPQNLVDEKIEGTSRNSWRARRQRRVAGKRKREEKAKQNKEIQKTNKENTMEGVQL